MVQFKTKQDAINAGYIPVNRKVDKDVSGHNFFGYDFENTKKEKSVMIYLTDVRNKIGDLGAYSPMFPPGGV